MIITITKVLTCMYMPISVDSASAFSYNFKIIVLPRHIYILFRFNIITIRLFVSVFLGNCRSDQAEIVHGLL